MLDGGKLLVQKFAAFVNKAPSKEGPIHVVLH